MKSMIVGMRLIEQAKFTGRIPRLAAGRVFVMNGVAMWHHRNGNWYVGEDRDVRHTMQCEMYAPQDGVLADMVERGFLQQFKTRSAAVRAFNANRPDLVKPDGYGPEDQ